ncbi:MAG: RluA family pseudouridine synthase [Clostridia bacterium]|nr:RluA family pseudouridine synthase [Clostridia bacterium]
MEELKRLDIYVAEREQLTRSASQKLIEDGNVTVNGRPSKKNYLVQPDDAVDVNVPEMLPDRAVPQDIPLDVVYEDDCLLVVNKPKGMVVHPAAGNPDGTLVNALLYHCGASLSGINGVLRPGIVHRIDKDTSGLLVVAKNDTAHVSLAEQISSHRFERTYLAMTVGHLKNENGRICKPIGRHPVDRKRMAVVAGGREAATNYEVLKRVSGYDMLRLRLETGRTHQIRVHMASEGHPVMGDKLYGGGRTRFEIVHEKLLCGQCLHASSISFVHPLSGDFLRFESPLPDYFARVIELLENEQ